MSSYTTKEKNFLISCYMQLPKVSIGIYDAERLFKKPLEYIPGLDIKSCAWEFKQPLRNSYLPNQSLFSENLAIIESIIRNNTVCICSIVEQLNDDTRVISFGLPVREAKGKWLKRFWLNYFH